MKKLLRILALLLLPLLAEATHEVSGYISFKHLSGTTYAVTIVTHTNGAPITDANDGCNTQADRDTMRIYYGDGTSELLVRSNGPTDYAGYPGGTSECSCRKINIYKGNPAGHTFPGAGSYHMWMDDADRMYNIVNIPGSGGYDFYLFSTLIVDPFAGDSVSTPIITNPLVCEYACIGECYYYNLGAYSPEGDSISYSLGDCLVLGGTKAPGSFIPPGATINPITGTLAWCNPTSPGIFNFSIRVRSYKHVVIPGEPSSWRPIDTMDVELEIIVNSNCECQNPVIKGPTDTCVIAGQLVTFKYTASDSTNNTLSMTAVGEPFVSNPAATFKGPSGGNPLTDIFSWQTDCAEVRNAPYVVTVKAVNPCNNTNTPPPYQNGLPLHSYLTTNIHVIGPAITGLTAKVVGNSVLLNWNPSICNQVVSYNVYRAVGCVKFVPGPCVTGVPASSGYIFIGNTTTTNFTDSTAIPGLYYSYLVCGVYPLETGGLSIASNDTCVLIRRDIPLLTNVSVDSTDSKHGTIFVRWIKPKIDTLDFDTTQYPGPYTYTLVRAQGMNGTNYIPVVTRTYPYFGSATDTTYKDTGINTQSNSYRYKLNFFYNTSTPIGSVPPASSIYLTTKPGNNTNTLSWSSKVPWADSTYMIYRHGPIPPYIFNYLTTVPGTIHSYTDTGLTNTKTYCYYVKSVSYYSDTTILHPLFDSSEIQCSAPKDTIPPCAPKLTVIPSCMNLEDSLIWNNPDHTCKGINNTVEYYKIYYSATETGDMNVIKTITNLNDTVLVFDSLTSVAGCYAVTAVDSFGNESRLNTVCVDNCPQYTLPNVFTPNGDGSNDLFTPILPYRYIKSIDINIFNRWGQVMFHTNNPMINWDGKDQNTHGNCPDGVYYYICVVNEIRVTGIQPVTLKGFVQILR